MLSHSVIARLVDTLVKGVSGFVEVAFQADPAEELRQIGVIVDFSNFLVFRPLGPEAPFYGICWRLRLRGPAP